MLKLIHEKLSLISAHQVFLAEECERRYGLATILRCHQAVWMRAEPPTEAESPFRMEPLSLDMADEVCARYSHDIGLDNIEGRLRAGAVLGAYMGDELTGFIGLHEEGSMGMLEVMPRFRRMGIAYRKTSGVKRRSSFFVV